MARRTGCRRTVPSYHCHRCGAEYRLPGPPGRSEVCPCGADLRVCRNCANYDPRVAQQCTDQRAEEVADKEQANFCEWFEMAHREWRPSVKDNRREDAARNALQRLLGD